MPVLTKAFRYDNRQTDDGSGFARTLWGIEGKGLTYKHLIGKGEEPRKLQLLCGRVGVAVAALELGRFPLPNGKR